MKKEERCKITTNGLHVTTYQVFLPLNFFTIIFIFFSRGGGGSSNFLATHVPPLDQEALCNRQIVGGRHLILISS